MGPVSLEIMNSVTYWYFFVVTPDLELVIPDLDDGLAYYTDVDVVSIVRF